MLNYKSIRILTWFISLTLATWLISDLPFNTIFETIVSLTTVQWFYWLSVNLVIILIFVWRWQALTKGLKLKLHFFNLLLLRQAGQSISFITPGPQFGGEPLQIFFLWKKYLISPSNAVVAVTVDRVFELWTNFSVLLIGIMVLFYTQEELANWFSIALLLGLIILFLSLSIWLLINQRETIENAINKWSKKWLKSKYLAVTKFRSDKVTDSLNSLLTNKTALSAAVLLCISGWSLTFFELYLVLSFFNINLGISHFILLIVAMRLAFLLPLPGGIGTLEASVFWSFTALALPITSAAALLALIRFRDIVVIGGGFICLRLLQSKTVLV
ncbi:MAG: lysylphosphatidylglycerol synthase transmembrane domain-containing protein [Pseudohongiellaceae bacterium]